MSIQTSEDWQEVERLAQEHEQRVALVLEGAGIQNFRITVEDRLRGAIVSAIADIECGCLGNAVKTLEGALGL